MHIAIAGNIGSGKTTLTKLLSKHYEWEPHYEAMDNNPYITDFYDDMQRWSFNLQVYFLNNRYRQIQTIFISSSFFQSPILKNLYHVGGCKSTTRRKE